MSSKSPTKSPGSDSAEDYSIQTRSSYKNIQPRDSIHSKRLLPNDVIRDDKTIKEGNKSPLAQRKIYPDLREFTPDESREDTQSPQKKSPRDESSQEREKTPYPPPEEESVVEKESSSNLIWCTIAVVLVALVVGYLMLSPPSKPSTKHDQPSIDCSNFMSLNEKYTNQDKKLFKALQAGIEGMYKRTPQVPTVVTFFSTDENAINAVLSDIIKIAKECINQSHDPLLLTHKDLNNEKFLKDNRKIISEYKNRLQESTIMVINNVDKIESSIVGSLHSFADTVNPLVRESILYLTVKVPEEPVGNKVSYIYKYLNNQWKDLADNIRDPLITRFIDQTFYIPKS